MNPLDILEGRKGLPSDLWSYKLAGSGAGATYGIDVVLSDRLDIDESKMSVCIPFASGINRDGVGDLLEVEGIRTERHRANPICLYDHGKSITLPVGLTEDPDTKQYTVIIDPVAKRATMNVFFYQGRKEEFPDLELDEIELARADKKLSEHARFCEQLYDLIAKRFVRAGSISYQIIHGKHLEPDMARGTPPGLHLLSVLMLEGSAVVMPANMDTVRKGMPSYGEQAREILALPGVCGRPLSPVLVKSLAPYVGEVKAMVNGADVGSKAKEEIAGDLNWLKEEEAEIDHKRVKALRKRYGKAQPSDKISPRKAERILHDNSAQGHPLTEKQRHMFGAAAGRDRKGMAERIKELGATGKAAQGSQGGQGATTSHTTGSTSVPKTTATSKQRTVGNDPSVHSGHGSETGTEGTGPYNRTTATYKSTKGSEGIKRPKTSEEVRANEASKEAARIRAQVDGKSLSATRLKYRREAKGLRRRLRKSVAGTSVMYVGSKDLPTLEAEAGRVGIDMQHVGPHGKGIDKVKLTGDDKAIDGLARKFGKPIKNLGGARHAKMLRTPDITPEGRLLGTVPSPLGNISVRSDRDRVSLSAEGGLQWDGRISPAREVVWSGQPPEPAVAAAVKALLKRTKAMQTKDWSSDTQAALDRAGIKYDPVQHGQDQVMLAIRGGAAETTRAITVLQAAGIQATRQGNGRINVHGKNLTGKKGAETMAKQAKAAPVAGKKGAKGGFPEMDKQEDKIENKGKKALPDGGAEGPEGEAVGGAAPVDEGGPAPEKHGAQVLRRMHEDRQLLLDQYDELTELIDNDSVKEFCEGLMENIVKELDEIEAKFAEHYPEAEPLAEAEESEEIEHEVEEGDEELPDSEEAAEAMHEEKALRAKYIKALRKAHGKAVCPECGKAASECKCSGKSLKGKGKELNPVEHEVENDLEGGGQDMPHGGLQGHEKPMVEGAATFLKDVSQRHDWADEHRMEAYHHAKSLGGIHERIKSDFGFEEGNAPHQQEERTGGMQEGVKSGGGAGVGPHGPNETISGSNDAERGRTISGEGGDSPHQGQEKALVWHKALKDASGHLRSLADAHDLTDEHRAQAAQHHAVLTKALDEAQQMEAQDELAEVNEPGEMGEKRLASVILKQNKTIKELTSKMSGLLKLAN
jgi:hypothetical protein